ncbi:MAG: accessory factor UbiK family protein [Thiotrichaceae bacterium]
MNSKPTFETLFKQFTESLPAGVLELHRDLEKNLRMGMEATFKQMNLVTREEFEVQSAVLARTRARLEVLEAQVAALEAKISPEVRTSPPELNSPNA